MSDPTKIISFEVENVKRVKVVEVSCDGKALLVLGGDNRQGKSSVLDAIKWALIGKTAAPSSVKREGSEADPQVKVALSNGLIVERHGEPGYLKITAPNGFTSGKESDLRQIINLLSLDLSKFINASAKEKASYLLQVIGHEKELLQFDAQEQYLENERTLTGRENKSKTAYAQSLPKYDDVPAVPVTLSELLQRRDTAAKTIAERQRLTAMHEADQKQLADQEAALVRLTEQVAKLRETVEAGTKFLAEQSALPDLAAIEKQLTDNEALNIKIRANEDKAKAAKDALDLTTRYQTLGKQIDDVRAARLALLSSVKLPLDGLTIANGELLYQNRQWDCLSGSDQLVVATSIVRQMNPDCGFVLIDGLEQMDMTTLDQFGRWLQDQGMQAITTRVSKGAECSVIIEDGMVAPSVQTQPKTEQQ